MQVTALDKTFQIDIVTPDKTALSREVVSAIVPAAEGYMGILANHAPLMAALRAGKIQLTARGETKAVVVISGGFMDVNNNKVTILAESVDYIEEKTVRDFSGLDMVKADDALKAAKKHASELEG